MRLLVTHRKLDFIQINRTPFLVYFYLLNNEEELKDCVYSQVQDCADCLRSFNCDHSPRHACCCALLIQFEFVLKDKSKHNTYSTLEMNI